MSAPMLGNVPSLSKFTTLMTKGTSGGKAPENGFDTSPAFGSLGSSTFFKGLTCTGYWTFAATSITVSLNGTLPQGTLYKAVCSVGTFLGSAATFSQSGGETSWTWTTGGDLGSSGTETVELWG